MRAYTAWDKTDGAPGLEMYEFAAASDEEARKMAEEWQIDAYDDGAVDATFWARTALYRGTEREIEALVMEDPWSQDDERFVAEWEVPIYPGEPPCESGAEHDWQAPYEIVGGNRENPGVWLHGGGVIIHELCVRCGCGRVEDTWAQGPHGEGYQSVRYEPGAYDISALVLVDEYGD